MYTLVCLRRFVSSLEVVDMNFFGISSFDCSMFQVLSFCRFCQVYYYCSLILLLVVGWVEADIKFN